MDKRNSDDAIKWWNTHAESLAALYTAQGDRHREVLLNHVLLSLLGSVKDNRILDAGCGEGYFSRILAGKGAHVVGVDYSQNMLDIAKKRTSAEYAIQYYYGNLEDLSFLKSESFDIIVSNMVLQDLSDYKKALQEMYRLLIREGVLIFSISHPCFITPESGWVKKNGKKLFWKVNHYFEERVFEQPWPMDAQDGVLLFHRTLTSYFKAIKKAGFVVEEIVEPKPSQKMIQKYPEFEHDLRMCQFLVFKVKKL
ncbi:MAG: class I SAM-dependent methyltransferase [Candidatus Methanofastidiosia archaeon]|jgi:ubiquinone/menaquinone biosynthesis C-methylase UbiE